jgi:hypothetical protein
MSVVELNHHNIESLESISDAARKISEAQACIVENLIQLLPEKAVDGLIVDCLEHILELDRLDLSPRAISMVIARTHAEHEAPAASPFAEGIQEFVEMNRRTCEQAAALVKPISELPGWQTYIDALGQLQANMAEAAKV